MHPSSALCNDNNSCILYCCISQFRFYIAMNFIHLRSYNIPHMVMPDVATMSDTECTLNIYIILYSVDKLFAYSTYTNLSNMHTYMYIRKGSKPLV